MPNRDWQKKTTKRHLILMHLMQVLVKHQKDITIHFPG
jgi:hypothetical protein